MSTPLVDIDANPRQPGFRAIKDGSKIPSPPKFQRSGGTGRRSPFSVSKTGSPCYTVMPSATKAIVSPTPTSRLPRKSTPTQSAFSKSYTYGTRPATPRSSLPRSRGGLKQSAPLTSDFDKATPPLGCNKPLPSPPIAQLVNPQSPPKAQRTLVDADAGSPTEEEWPILRPENISPSKTLTLPASDCLPQRSMSEGSALRRNGIPMLKSRLTTPSSVENPTPFLESSVSTADNGTSHEKFRQMTKPRTFSSMNPYAKSFHAFSTNTEVAIDSPLAYKRCTPPLVSIPPRTSSKRSSLLWSDKTCDEAPMPPSSEPSRSVKPGSTKWPVLETATDQFLFEQISTEELRGHEQQRPAEAMSDDSPPAESRCRSIDNISMWSLAAESSLNDKSEDNYEGRVRVKRISWLSSNPNSGPTLRISAEADAVLLGRDDSIPAVPALPKHVPEKGSQERSLSALAGHVSKQILVKMIPSTGSRSLTPSSGEAEENESKPVKITPIRSMQPPRKPSTGDLSKRSTSPVGLVPKEIGQDEQIRDLSPGEARSSFRISHEKTSSQTKTSFKDQKPNEVQQHSYAASNYPTTPQVSIPLKATQVLGMDGDIPMPAAQKRLPMTWTTPKSATSIAKKGNTKRSKTSPSLLSAERFNNRASASSTRVPSSASSKLAQSNLSHTGALQPDQSKLRATIDSPHANDYSEEAQHTEQDAADTVALKIKAKRSFRNIFHRRDPKSTPRPAKKQDSKRSSVAGSALAQRIRNSTNLSKVSLANPSNANVEVEQSIAISLNNGTVSIESNRQATLSALDPGSSDTSLQSTPAAQYDTATVVYKILDRVTSIEADSPDRLRGLEIAEAVLHAVECSKEAKVSAELARKHARDAELHAERAGVELKRLEKLCEPNFDREALQAMKQLITAAGMPELSETAEE